MNGNFVYSNPTKLYFGDNAISFLSEELRNYGPKVMLCYGGGSIKKNGIYDDVIRILKDAGKTIIEDPGVMSNPTTDKLMEGARLARENDIDLILAVGGGSTIDYAKGVSVSAWCKDDPWDKYYIRMEDVDNRVIPVGSVLTMVGTGSEMNGGSVITNTQQKLKIGMVFGDNVMPKFAILNPKYTFTVPRYQMVAGIYDIFNHICEQYFSGDDDNTSDYISEGLMRSVVHASRIAVQNPQDYEARSNLMWCASWALNTLIGKGKSGDWMVHMMGQAVGAYTDATHGMTLAAVSIPYYRFIMESGLPKFARFARTVWDVDTKGMTEKQAAEAGLDAMEKWMKDIGVVMRLGELGVTEDMIEGITDSTFLLDGGYRALTREEAIGIFRAAL
jgi:alcohol dehydrogenase YqhD (iron-dependent ADH family)